MIMQEYVDKIDRFDFREWYKGCVHRETIRINKVIMESQKRKTFVHKIIKFFKENF